MAKQEEIRQWINKYLTQQFICDLSLLPDDECLSEAKAILMYLDSRGVGIKVERKEPFNCGHAQMTAARYSQDVTCPLIEAGCGFFEPLI